MTSRLLSCVVIVLAVGGCRDAAPPPVEKPAPSPSRAPVGLLGTWVRNPPLDVRHDTLVLRADSTATGWTREYHSGDTVFAVARWKVEFLSKDPAVSRADQPGRYQDGGDHICTIHPDSTCVSAPMFCLGPAGKLSCQGMTFRGDTLWLSGDGRFVRVARGDSVGS
jgi:hypothetical protein